MKLSGPMFEQAESRYWKSIYGKDGAHYNIFAIGPSQRIDVEEKAYSMAALYDLFENGEADELNFCLFSTSGIHGTYSSIENAERWVAKGCPSYDSEDWPDAEADCVTFLIVQPRTVTLRYGNVYPTSQADIEFLKSLRASSWRAVQQIGNPQ